MKKPVTFYHTDTWGCSILDDWDRMPASMQLGFWMYSKVYKHRTIASITFMWAAIFICGAFVAQLFLVDNAHSNPLFFWAVIISMAALFVELILPVIIWIPVYSWYLSAREHWPPDTEEK